MLRIGKILKSHGTDGGLLVSAPEVELEQITGPVYVEFDALPAPFFIDDCVARGSSRYVVHITGVNSLKDAEEMVGRDILFDGSFEDSDESLPEDFIGWTVKDAGGAAFDSGSAGGAGAADGSGSVGSAGAADGSGSVGSAALRLVGVVEDYEPIPGNFCLYVRTPAGEQVMIPLHEDFVVSVDPSSRELILDLPSGLY